MTAREYAKKNNFKIVGNLKRHSYESGLTVWVDEENNEFWHTRKGWLIVTADGGII